MNNLQIDRVTGGFIVTTPTERGVACSVHALVAAVQVWATSEAMDYETTLACAAPPTVAPDAAPAPFRVGDRVVFRSRNKRQDPLTITQVRGDGCRLDIEDAAHIWYDMLEFRHAPVEDL